MEENSKSTEKSPSRNVCYSTLAPVAATAPSSPTPALAGSPKIKKQVTGTKQEVRSSLQHEAVDHLQNCVDALLTFDATKRE